MMDELINDFIAETRDNLESLTSQILNWEKNPNDSESVACIFRFVHTVKGSCGFLDLPRLLALSHAAEDIMSEARDGNILPTHALVSTVLLVVDRIAILVDALETHQEVKDDDADLIANLYTELEGARTSPVAEPAQTSDSQSFAQSFAQISSVNEHNMTDSVEDDISEPNDEMLDIFNNNQEVSENKTIRVSLNLLNNLMSGVSDLVLARNEVSRKLSEVLDKSDVDVVFGRLTASVSEMRDAVGLMRMQNIEHLFSALPRLVRDISEELDKDIELKIEGGEVEVDREMIEALRDPLKHIVRNAADHGIESKEERIAAAKNPTGTITINARQLGNQILIEIIDDGSGINLNDLGQKVIGAKLKTYAQWEAMSEKAKLDMIFSPGISTAESVTAISGRGVGMDVVRTNIMNISGAINVENNEGHGLKLTLSLPLTLSIIAGLSMRCGNQMFAISRNSVQELILKNNKNVVIEEIGGSKVACIRGQRFPYARLSDLVGIKEKAEQTYNSRTLVVVKPALGKSYVIDVDAVIDNEELVVKPGAPILMASGLYAGTSLPDNGCPLLLLDANAVADKICINNLDDMAEEILDEEDKIHETKLSSALLFESLEGELKSIRLSVLDRLEEVETKFIGNSGGINRVKIKDKLYQIFGLKTIPEAGIVKLLRLSDGECWKFLAVKEVIDIIKLDENIAPSLHPETIEGVLTVDERQVELINPYQFFEHDGAVQMNADQKPLCYIDSNDGDEWSTKMLLPLLNAAGYRISTDKEEAQNADVILSLEGEDNDGEDKLKAYDTDNCLNLRKNMAANENNNSIYRYDRLGLLAAIEEKIAKG